MNYTLGCLLITLDLSESACDGIISTVNKEEGGHAIFPLQRILNLWYSGFESVNFCGEIHFM